MAMNGEGLGALICSELKAAGFSPEGSHTVNKPFWDAIGKAVVKHIQAAAEVRVTVGDSAGVYRVQ